MSESIYQKLSKINIDHLTEDVNGSTYLSWGHAWHILKENYPQAKKTVLENEKGQSFFVSDFGIEVRVKIEIDDTEVIQNLAVMNSKNEALKLEPYSYKEWRRKESKMIEINVEDTAHITDIHNAQQRCLVKAIAALGLGMNIFRGLTFDGKPLKNKSDKKDIKDAWIVGVINGFCAKDELKAEGFKWDGDNKMWIATLEKEDALRIQEKYHNQSANDYKNPDLTIQVAIEKKGGDTPESV